MTAFVLVAAAAVVCGVLVVTARQPVHAALALVGSLLAVAAAYVTLDAHFLAAVQVIVYAGAVMVLFLFVIMLLNVERQRSGDPWRALRPAAYGLGAVLAVAAAAVSVASQRPAPDPAAVTAALDGGSAERVGTVLFSDYLLAFHLVGVLLLTGVVAAVSLVQRGRPAAAEPVRAVAESAGEPA